MIFEHRHGPSCIAIRLDMEPPDPPQPAAGQAKLAHCHAALDGRVAGHAVAVHRLRIHERPLVEAAASQKLSCLQTGNAHAAGAYRDIGSLLDPPDHAVGQGDVEFELRIARQECRKERQQVTFAEADGGIDAQHEPLELGP